MMREMFPKVTLQNDACQDTERPKDYIDGDIGVWPWRTISLIPVSLLIFSTSAVIFFSDHICFRSSASKFPNTFLRKLNKILETPIQSLQFMFFRHSPKIIPAVPLCVLCMRWSARRGRRMGSDVHRMYLV